MHHEARPHAITLNKKDRKGSSQTAWKGLNQTELAEKGWTTCCFAIRPANSSMDRFVQYSELGLHILIPFYGGSWFFFFSLLTLYFILVDEISKINLSKHIIFHIVLLQSILRKHLLHAFSLWFFFVSQGSSYNILRSWQDPIHIWKAFSIFWGLNKRFQKHKKYFLCLWNINRC